MKKIIITALFTLLFFGCAQWEDISVPKTKIASVYIHEVGSYSVGVIDGRRLKIVKISRKVPVEIIIDAETDAQWYMCAGKQDRNMGRVEGGCQIHITSVDAVYGAGWDHGKFGNGRTVRIK